MIIAKYLLVWIGLIVLAILNGGLRNEGYGKFVSELTAHQISTFVALIVFSAYLWIISGYWRIPSRSKAILICGLWLSFTVIFEFLFGHFVMGHPWSKLLHDYNLLEGRIWVLVLIWTATAPYVVYVLRAKNNT